MSAMQLFAMLTQSKHLKTSKLKTYTNYRTYTDPIRQQSQVNEHFTSDNNEIKVCTCQENIFHYYLQPYIDFFLTFLMQLLTACFNRRLPEMIATCEITALYSIITTLKW